MPKQKSHDRAKAISMDLNVPDAVMDRPAAHSLAFGVFLVGAVLAWCKVAEPFAIGEALRILAIAWFPPVIVELFRRLPVPNPAVAAALLSGIAGYDGVLRLLLPWYSAGC